MNVVNTPTVSSQQSGTWSVGIASGAQVGLNPSTNTVKIDPSNNIVNVGNSTVLALDVTETVNGAGLLTFGALDVSLFKEIRIVVSISSGVVDFLVEPRIRLDPNSPEVVILDHLNAAKTGEDTKTYDILCQRIDFVLAGGTGTSQVHVQVYGRSN